MKKRVKLTKAQIRHVKELDKSGKARTEISKETGINYHQVVYCLLKAGKRKKAFHQSKIATISEDSETNYRELYLKAVSLLIEKGIIEVTF